MQRSYFDTSRPIAALATVPGESALAVIRCAGPRAVDLVAGLFSRPAALGSAQSMSLVHGELVDPSDGTAVDEILAAVFLSPDGPIGEDGVELYCHGSPAVIRRALFLLEGAGFAPALPGEFSFRAFLHGKTDLVKAEAVQELVRADSEGARVERFAASKAASRELSLRFARRSSTFSPRSRRGSIMRRTTIPQQGASILIPYGGFATESLFSPRAM